MWTHGPVCRPLAFRNGLVSCGSDAWSPSFRLPASRILPVTHEGVRGVSGCHMEAPALPCVGPTPDCVVVLSPTSDAQAALQVITANWLELAQEGTSLSCSGIPSSLRTLPAHTPAFQPGRSHLLILSIIQSPQLSPGL